jgi:GTPase SAR1 family protein
MIEKTKENNNSYESVICANKFDLVEEDSMKRMVSEEEINDFKIKEKIDIFNTSTKSGYNINVAFRKLIELILLKQRRKLLGKNELPKKKIIYEKFKNKQKTYY